VPTEEELRAVWGALRDGDDYSDIVKLLILTAARRGEIGDLQWSEVNLDAAVIEIPAVRMKNGKPHVVPLSGPALARPRPAARTAKTIGAAAKQSSSCAVPSWRCWSIAASS
jgi:integrase